MNSKYLGSQAEINGTIVDSWGGYADGQVELIYTDLISGTIGFLNIFAGFHCISQDYVTHTSCYM